MTTTITRCEGRISAEQVLHPECRECLRWLSRRLTTARWIEPHYDGRRCTQFMDHADTEVGEGEEE